MSIPGRHDVSGRDVAVHDVEAVPVGADEVVREIESAADAARDVRRQRLRHRPTHFAVPVDDTAQRRAGNELHGDEEVAGDFAELINLDDVAVQQVRRQLRFVDEELKELRSLRVVWMDDLERDALREPGRAELLRLVNGRHPAFRDFVHELEGSVILEQSIGIDHVRGA